MAREFLPLQEGPELFAAYVVTDRSRIHHRDYAMLEAIYRGSDPNYRGKRALVRVDGSDTVQAKFEGLNRAYPLPFKAFEFEPSELSTLDYMTAPMGIGPQADEWNDKPHRLLYDLCQEVNRLRSQLLMAELDAERAQLEIERLEEYEWMYQELQS